MDVLRAGFMRVWRSHFTHIKALSLRVRDVRGLAEFANCGSMLPVRLFPLRMKDVWGLDGCSNRVFDQSMAFYQFESPLPP